MRTYVQFDYGSDGFAKSGGILPHSKTSRSASALIIVLWVAFGLVALTLYFGQSMSFELQSADNRVSAMEAEQAIAGAARYVTNVLARMTEPGLIPDTNSYRSADFPVGEARVWFIGRNDRQNFGAYNAWGLVDEGSKLNLNVVTTNMLELLPNMTPELAAAIIDWRDTDDEATQGGAESDYYMRLDPGYRAKNTNYESVAELRMVAGFDLNVLFGEDANLNGVLDLNENDSETTMPFDNRDGRLDAGFMEYFTIYTRIPTVGTNVNERTNLVALLETKLGGQRATEIAGGGIGPQTTYSNLLHFFFAANLTRDEMTQLEGFLVCTNATNALININTASEAVLACIPGIGTELAPQLIAFRQSNGQSLNTIAWLKEALNWTWQDNRAQIIEVGNWICGRSYQMSADIAAVGHHGRGYKRVKYIFDVADGYAQVRARQDLTYLGWALGRQVRDSMLASNIR
jgi:type II secretory pathway component PulK